MSIYTCQTLVQLRLCAVALPDAEFVSLPCLKVMDLNYVRPLSEATVENLISGSPVLEDLMIFRCCKVNGNVIQVRSQTLKRIHMYEHAKFAIDAPRLQCLKTYILHKNNFKIVRPGFPAKVDIQVSSIGFDKTMVDEIFTDISKVRELVICRYISKGIFQYLKSGPWLHLRYLSCLSATCSKSDLELLPTLLESCPNLKFLILEIVKDYMQPTEEEETNVMFSTVPQCLVSSLKLVKLKRSLSSTPECEGEMELVRYLLKNSRILEKLTLLFFTKKARSAILAMPRCSSSCQVR